MVSFQEEKQPVTNLTSFPSFQTTPNLAEDEDDLTCLGANHFLASPKTVGELIRIQIIHRKTGTSQKKVLSPAIANQGGVLIGRSSKCNIVLNSLDVSRVHGKIVHTNRNYYFLDLGSTTGSQVNNCKVPTNQQILLKPEDIIRIGSFVLLVEEFQLANSAPAQPTNLPILEFSASQPKQLIFKAEEIQAQGILLQGASEFMFEGRSLVAFFSLSKRLRPKAMSLWQAERDAGRFCILIEHATHFTLWRERASRNSLIP
jgi:pSer/pThr/pTyr-binding forkhead associated (FHA) protein